MKINHKRGKERTDDLSQHDYFHIYQMMNDVRERQNQILKMKPVSPNKKQSVSDTEFDESVFDVTEEFNHEQELKPLFKVPGDLRFTNSREINGICLDCGRQRCPICKGCDIDMFEKVQGTAHCQRCICSPYEEQEPLNDTGIPLGELVRKRQGTGFKNSGGLKYCKKLIKTKNII